MQLSVKQRDLLTRIYFETENRIKSAGFQVRIEIDFERARDEIKKAGKQLMPFFWHSYFQANGYNGFFVVLEKDGVGVSYICTRLIDCGAMNFHDVYTDLLKAIYSHDGGARLDPDWVCEPMQSIRGKVAYAGDAVVHKDHRSGIKSAEAFGLVARLSLYFSVLQWPDIDWAVGTVSEKDVIRGLPWYYGATAVYPMAEKWLSLPEGRGANYALCSSSKEDILYGAKAAIRQLESRKHLEDTEVDGDQLPRSETGE